MSIKNTVSSLVVCGVLGACTVTPEALTGEEVVTFTDDRRIELDEGQIAVTAPISLYEAMARALKYNIDYKVELLDKAVRYAELQVPSEEGLPAIVANSDYFSRDNLSGGTSRSIISSTQAGPVSLASSTSQERQLLTGDISLSWNILDFGLSKVRSEQNADRVLIAEESKRRIVNRIIEDVRTAYWRALSSQRLLGKLSGLERQVQGALSDSRAQSNNSEIDPITALTYERELLQIKREIQILEGELKVAKTQLGALMSLKPGTKYKLVDPKRHIPHMTISSADLIDVAYLKRPEMREVIYEARINDKELEASLLELLPGLQLYAGANSDSNDLLFNSDWLSAGIRASWNLIKIFQLPKRKRVIEAQDELLKRRGLALALAIATQVHVSKARFIHAQREYSTSSEYLSVQRRLLSKIRASAEVERASRQTLIREQMNTLVAQIRHDVAYAEVQNAYANIFAGIGLDTFSSFEHANLSLTNLTAKVGAVWKARENGYRLDQLKPWHAVYSVVPEKRPEDFGCEKEDSNGFCAPVPNDS